MNRRRERLGLTATDRPSARTAPASLWHVRQSSLPGGFGAAGFCGAAAASDAVTKAERNRQRRRSNASWKCWRVARFPGPGPRPACRGCVAPRATGHETVTYSTISRGGWPARSSRVSYFWQSTHRSRSRRRTLPLDETAPLGHPLVHPHRRRRSRAELAPAARPRHAFGSHGTPSAGFGEAPRQRPRVGAAQFSSQPICRSEESPCGIRVGKDGKADLHDRSFHGLTDRGGYKRNPMREPPERRNRCVYKHIPRPQATLESLWPMRSIICAIRVPIKKATNPRNVLLRVASRRHFRGSTRTSLPTFRQVMTRRTLHENPELRPLLDLFGQKADLAALHRKVVAEFRLAGRHVDPLVVEPDDGIGGRRTFVAASHPGIVCGGRSGLFPGRSCRSPAPVDLERKMVPACRQAPSSTGVSVTPPSSP